jgi:hypothetical protein
MFDAVDAVGGMFAFASDPGGRLGNSLQIEHPGWENVHGFRASPRLRLFNLVPLDLALSGRRM